MNFSLKLATRLIVTLVPVCVDSLSCLLTLTWFVADKHVAMELVKDMICRNYKFRLEKKLFCLKVYVYVTIMLI